MTNQEIAKLLTDKVIAQLETGKIPWRKPWVGLEAQNLISRKPYRGINAIITACSDHKSPFWLSYKQAIDFGGVRPGEHGTRIVFWKMLEKGEGEEKQTIPMLRYSVVFNADQVGTPGQFDRLTEIALKDVPALPECEATIAAWTNKPTIEHGDQRAYYQPSLDRIRMPERQQFGTSGEYYSTLFHELGHSTGHKDRLNRRTLTDSHGFGTHLYSQEELVAEICAGMLCGKHGIESTLDNSAAYLAGWLGKLKNDRGMLIHAAAQAQRAADLILGVKWGEESEEKPSEPKAKPIVASVPKVIEAPKPAKAKKAKAPTLASLASLPANVAKLMRNTVWRNSTVTPVQRGESLGFEIRHNVANAVAWVPA